MIESCLSEKNLSPITFGDQDDDVRSVLGAFSGISGLGLSLSGCSKKGFAGGATFCSVVGLGRRTGPGCRGGATNWAKSSMGPKLIFNVFQLNC